MKNRLADVSPWILAAAFTLLAFIIGAFAVNNYSREKALMTEALLQKGLAVMRFLETGVRVSMRAGWQGRGTGGTGRTSNWQDHVQGVIDQLHDQNDIHYVELMDSSGTILAASREERIGVKVDSKTLIFAQGGGEEEPVYRIHEGDDGGEAGFQVARSMKTRLRSFFAPNGQRGRMMENMRRMPPEMEHMQEEFERLQGQEFMLVVELDLKQFNSAVHGQLLQIVILSVVLLLVGAGGWLSLLTLQGFKGTRSRLQRMRAFNEMLVEALPIGLIATDSRGTIQLANQAVEEMVGIGADRLVGKSPVEALPELLARPFSYRGKKNDEPHNYEETITVEGGDTRNLFLTIMGVSDEKGDSTGDVLLLQDMSDLRQLEAKLRRNERLAALGRMAAGVAHELRNPLSSIKGLAVLLKGRIAEDPEGRRTADVLVQEVERLNRSISELLDYARPEKLQTATISLHKVLEKASTLVGVDAAEQNIRIIPALTLENDLVEVDEDRMNQVFLNLMLNAIQAMPNGGELRIVTEREKEWLICTIIDDGEGIAEENMGRLFDPYFTTKSDGTGLGLALSAKIVEEHGGTIAISSTLGHGTQVRLQLPAAT